MLSTVHAGTIGAKASSAVDDQFLGSLFSLEKDGTVRKHISGINLSNGLAWSADNRIMYYVDTIPGKVYAFDFDLDSGTMSEFAQNESQNLDKKNVHASGLPTLCIYA